MQAPGPSTLSFLAGVRGRGFLDTVGELWRAHGDVSQVRIGKRRLLFAMHPDAVKQVNVTNRQRYDKRASYDNVRDHLTGQGLVASTGDVWRRQRRLMAPFFTTQGVTEYADIMIEDGLRFVDRWQGLAQRGEEVEIGEEMTQITASIILKAMFSTETISGMGHMRESIATMISWVTHRLAGVPWPLWVPTPGNRRFLAAQSSVYGAIEGLIAARRATPPEQWPDDLLSRLMRVRDEETGAPMSDTLLRDECITIFVAGHETTARTMTFAWYALAANPEVAERLHAELDAVLGGRTPTLADLKQLPYTLRVVKEILRMYPPAPFYSRDAVEADMIGEVEIPVGAAVMLSPYFTHRHPDFWPDAERFDPDRWTPEREAAQHGFAWHPFAAGQRICLGNHFSLLETHLLLAILGQRFSPRLRPGYTARWEMQGVLSLADGLPMTIAAR